MFKQFPTFSICSLDNKKSTINDFAIYKLRDFINENKGLVFPHRHSFYQVLYITEGNGTHVIDFNKYVAEPGNMFFLAPGQIHEWIFEDNINGILINFSENFFSSFLANRYYIKDFTFFIGNGSHSLVKVNEDEVFVNQLLSNISEEYCLTDNSHLDIIRLQLLHLFNVINRKISNPVDAYFGQNYAIQLRNFEKKIEDFYLTKRLPKEYAAMLFITPNHLNAICKKIKGVSAGRLIRNRVLLEAKRLLVNSDKNIGEISIMLNFENNSYFSRFFKQYEGITPEEFKKSNNQS